MTEKALADYDFFSEEVLECPFDFYKLLREEAPVYLLPGTNLFTPPSLGTMDTPSNCKSALTR